MSSAKLFALPFSLESFAGYRNNYAMRQERRCSCLSAETFRQLWSSERGWDCRLAREAG